MKELTFATTVKSYAFDELPETYRQLVEKAKAMTCNSYSPYSGFRVGAALLLDNGEILGGTNQENAAYPSGLCAERTAMFDANANYPDVPVRALAVACYANGHFTDEPGSPCGSCRQSLLETEHRFGKDIPVILYGEKHTIVFESVRSTLPYCFVNDSLQG